MVYNNMMVFYMNLCFFLVLVLILSHSLGASGGVWVSISGDFGVDSYSYYMVLLSIWVLGLMYMSVLSDFSNFATGKLKMVMFSLTLMILIMYFSTFNFLLMYFFFEVSLIPTFFIVLYWGGSLERVEAGFYLLMYMLLVSIPLFFYIIRLHLMTSTMDLNLMGVYMLPNLGIWDFLVLMGAFMIKLPIYLFHIWLPKAHVEAPVYGSMVLAAVLLKLGGYGLLRLMYIFVKTSLYYSSFFISLSLLGSLYVSVFCLVQSDMKSLVAYSSVVHMNFMLCSLFTLGKTGTWGSYIMMITHGLCSSGLFYMVNMIYQRSFSRLLVLNKGYLNVLPSMLVWWFLMCASNFSFPFSLNFLGEVLMIMSIISWSISLSAMMFLVCFFSGAYSLYLFSAVSHGEVIGGLRLFGPIGVLDHLSLIMHYFPLLGLLLNVLFM